MQSWILTPPRAGTLQEDVALGAPEWGRRLFLGHPVVTLGMPTDVPKKRAKNMPPGVDQAPFEVLQSPPRYILKALAEEMGQRLNGVMGPWWGVVNAILLDKGKGGIKAADSDL
eukprot:749784-Alexandrium_andersonii.AAC.1